MAESKKDRLGRGLGALLGEYSVDSPAGAPRPSPASDLRTLAISAIRPNPLQPRTEFAETELKELADSIAENGLLQPLVVRPRAGGQDEFELVAGERRFRAVQRLSWTEVPVLIREVDDRMLLVLALVENLQREGLSVLDEAEGFKALQEKFGLTQAEVARAVGKTRSAVTNTLRLLGLPPSVRRLLEDGKIAMGHARALLGVADPVRAADLARRAAEGKWSVREVERKAADTKKKARKPATSSGDSALGALEEELRSVLQTRVRIKGNKAQGTIEIPFLSGEDLERLFALIARREASEVLS